jgi:hypothetical protein
MVSCKESLNYLPFLVESMIFQGKSFIFPDAIGCIMSFPFAMVMLSDENLILDKPQLTLSGMAYFRSMI